VAHPQKATAGQRPANGARSGHRLTHNEVARGYIYKKTLSSLKTDIEKTITQETYDRTVRGFKFESATYSVVVKLSL
jgi:hypothetical protein